MIGSWGESVFASADDPPTLLYKSATGDATGASIVGSTEAGEAGLAARACHLRERATGCWCTGGSKVSTAI